MKTIWKFKLSTTDLQEILMPIDAQILTVQMQYGIPCLWALLNTDVKNQYRKIKIYETGHEIKNETIEDYIGTYQLNGGSLIFHVFYAK